jgi:hypothetical protein
MTANCLAPGFFRLFYTSNGHNHVQTVGVDPTDSSMATWRTSGGSTNAFDAALDAYVALIAPFFHTTDVFTGAEVYSMPTCADAPVFKFAYDLNGGVNGTSSSADVDWTQCVLTYRTKAGGKFKLQLMETIIASDEKEALPTASAFIIALNTYLLGAGDVLYARDNSFPGFALNLVTKVNDKLRKKFLNP